MCKIIKTLHCNFLLFLKEMNKNSLADQNLYVHFDCCTAFYYLSNISSDNIY